MQLKSIVERIEHLEEEKADLMADIKEVFKEAKSSGYDAKIIKEVLKLRKMGDDEVSEHDALISTYLDALRG